MTYHRAIRLWRRVGLLLAGLTLACGAGVDERATDGGAQSIQFDTMGVLALAPKQTVPIELTANVTPVTLSLAGNYLDATLDSDTVNVGSDGHASFMLHAPSTASTFSVLAVSGVATARLDVAVSAVGFATVRVTVDYQGSRPVPSVEASAFVEQTCAQLANAPIDGAPLVQGTAAAPLAIPSVPTDGQVAINVRIAHYAVGCMDVGTLTPGATRDVTVNVFDLPFDLAHTTLETRFTFAPDPAAAMSLGAYFDEVSKAVLATSFAYTSNEGGELLNAMAAASTAATQFATARSGGGWDAATQTWLAARPPTMNARASTWLHAAAQAGLGDLTGHLASDPSSPTFVPKAIGTVDAAAAGLSAPLPFAWSGESGDVLAIAGFVSAPPSTLVCALADAQAIADVPTSTDVASAIGIDIDCAGLGKALVPSGYAYGTCDAACVAALCSTALTKMWASGAAALTKPTDALLLSITAAAPAVVSDTPTVQSFDGAWVGSFAMTTSNIATQGIAKGAFGTTPN